jgi:hypothetical protein
VVPAFVGTFDFDSMFMVAKEKSSSPPKFLSKGEGVWAVIRRDKKKTTKKLL